MDIGTLFILLGVVAWGLGAARVAAAVDWLQAGLCLVGIGVFLL